EGECDPLQHRRNRQSERFETGDVCTAPVRTVATAHGFEKPNCTRETGPMVSHVADHMPLVLAIIPHSALAIYRSRLLSVPDSLPASRARVMSIFSYEAFRFTMCAGFDAHEKSHKPQASLLELLGTILHHRQSYC